MKLPAQNDKHLDWFFSAIRSGRLPATAIKLFPNVKKIAESVATMALLKSHVNLREKCLVIDVGAGSSPRTGGIIAHMYPNVSVHSIDPVMRPEWSRSSECENLFAYLETIETWVDENVDLIATYETVAVTAVHSHALLEKYVPRLKSIITGRLVVLTMQCCVPQVLSDEVQTQTGMHMTFTKTDMGIHSPHRTMCIWTHDIQSRDECGESQACE